MTKVSHRANSRARIILPARQLVCDLRPSMKVKRVELVVLRVYPRRIINSKSFSGPIAAACGRDESGIVGLVLWDEQTKQVRVGDVIRITNGWAKEREGELVISTGKYGKLEVLDR